MSATLFWDMLEEHERLKKKIDEGEHIKKAHLEDRKQKIELHLETLVSAHYIGAEHFNNKRWVDLGCGLGPGAAVLKEYGAIVEGVEREGWQLDYAIRQGIFAHQTYQEDMLRHLQQRPDRSLEGICSFRMHDFFPTKAFVLEAERILRPGGIILLHAELGDNAAVQLAYETGKKTTLECAQQHEGLNCTFIGYAKN